MSCESWLWLSVAALSTALFLMSWLVSVTQRQARGWQDQAEYWRSEAYRAIGSCMRQAKRCDAKGDER